MEVMTLREELVPLYDRILVILYREKMASATAERYQMFKKWYDSVDELKPDLEGLLGYEYLNSAWEGGENT